MTSTAFEGRFHDKALAAAAKLASEAQPEFTSYMEKNLLDAAFFLRLVSIFEGSISEAIVLWDAIENATNGGLSAVNGMAAADHQRKYGFSSGSEHGSSTASERGYRRAVNNLVDDGFLIEVAQVRNVARKYFLNWPVVAEALANDVNMKLPGLRETKAR